MRRGWIVGGVVGLLVVTAVPWAAAGPKGRDRRDRPVDAEVRDVLALIGPVIEALGASAARTDDAPRLLADALRRGTADTAAFASIMRWVLMEREDRVAAGLAEALRAVPPPAGGPDAERWNATAHAVIGAFAGVLRDAETYKRRDGDAIVRGLVGAAAPAVIAAMSESDPAAVETLREAVQAFAPAARDMIGPLVQGLRHAEPAVRQGAAAALGALGSAAESAVPQLRGALDDPDPAVRDAAAQALERVQPR